MRTEYLLPLGIQDVVEVIHAVLWNYNGRQIIKVEILLRSIERQVRLGEADGHEERLVMVLLQLLLEPLGRLIVLGAFVAPEQRPERKTRSTALSVFGIVQLLTIHNAFVPVNQLRRIGFPATRFLPPNIKGPMSVIETSLGRVFMEDLS